jgi:hypothetical protein
MLKEFHLEAKGGRLGALKDRLLRDRKGSVSGEDQCTSGQNDPFPGRR